MAGPKARPNAADPREGGAAPPRPAHQGLADWLRRHAPPDAYPEGSPLGAPRWAVAFSGGADSTALLQAAVALVPGQVLALHVHHGLQAAADGFEAQVKARCAAWGVPWRVQRVNARHDAGQSPEDAARQARYRALAAMAQAEGVEVVWLGHHAQDQIETLLLALSRGAGLPGLSGMADRFERHGMVFGRPLLGCDAQALRAGLRADGIDWVDDPTNADEGYTRNRIRARLLPALQQAFPASAATFARSARHVAEAQLLLDELAAQDLATTGDPPRLAPLQALGRARQGNLLRHWLRHGWQAAPSDSQLAECLDQIAACRTRGHRIELRVADGWLRRDGDRLSFGRDL